MRNKILPILALSLALVLGGCKDDHSKIGDQADEGIFFDASVGALSKYAGSTSFDKGDQISLFGTKVSVALAATGNYIENSKYVRGDNYFAKDNGKDAFPSSGGLDLYSIYPYDANLATKGFPNAYAFTCAADQSSDLLTSDLLISKLEAVQPTLHPVKLVFGHAMGKVILNVNVAADYGGVTATYAGFKMISSATVNMATLTTTASGVATVIRPRNTLENGNLKAEAIVAPQTFAADVAFAEVSLSSGKTIPVSLPKDLVVEQGKFATIDVAISLGGGKAIVLGATVEDWGTVEIGSGQTVVERLRNGFNGTCTDATMANYNKAFVSVKASGETKITTLEVDVKSDVTKKTLYFEFRGANNVPSKFPYEIVNIKLVDGAGAENKLSTIVNGTGFKDQTIKGFTFAGTTATF